jgi:PAS domain S-box-containing protein
MTLDLDGRITYINHTVPDLNRQEVIGRPVYDYVEERFRPAMRGCFERVRRTAQADRYDVEYKDAGGDVRAFEARVAPMLCDGTMVGFTVRCTDVTDRKQMEDALRLSEQSYRQIFDAVNDMIVVHDAANGEIVDCNQKMADNFGCSMEEARAAGLEIVCSGEPPYTRENAVGLVKKSMREGPQIFEWPCQRKSGELFWVEVKLKPAVIGGFQRVLAVVRDITERKMAAEALQEAYDELERRVEKRTAELATTNEQLQSAIQDLRNSDRKYRQLYESMMDCYASVDMNGRITAFNKSFTDLIGYGEEEIPHLTYRDITPEQWHASEAEILDIQVLGRGYSDVYEKEYRRKDGTVFPVELRTFLMRGDSGQPEGMWAIVRDITQRKESEERLASEQQLLRKILGLQERERKLISHEIHDGFVQDAVGARMLLESACAKLACESEVPDELITAQNLLGKGINEARRMIGELRPLIIDEEGIVQSIDYLVAKELSDGEIAIDFQHRVDFDRLDPILEGTVFRIVQEALNNVKRHSQSATANVRLNEENGRILLEVCDQGIGFDPRQVASDRFGIRGIYERARLFEGCAVVESAPGKGTRVFVTLPVAASEPIAQQIESAAAFSMNRV